MRARRSAGSRSGISQSPVTTACRRSRRSPPRRRIRPDLVIVNWVGNDMELPNFLAERPNVYSLRRSFLLRAHPPSLACVARQAREVLDAGARCRSTRARETQARRRTEVPERYRPLLGTENMLQALDRLARPRPRTSNPPGRPVRLELAAGGSRPAESHYSSRIAVKQWCAARGYLVVDTEQRVVQYLESNHLDASVLWLSSSDPHPSVLRHRLIAEELVDALVRSGAIQGVTPSPADASLAPN